MKVVRIIARLNVGGPARHVAWLTAGLRRAGVESVLVAGTVPTGEDDMSYFAARLGVEPLIIPQMSREITLQDAVTIWKLYRLLLRERPDLVHTHTAKAGTVGRVAGLLYRWLTPAALLGRPRACRFVHTYHGHIFHSYYGPLKTRFFLAVEKFLARAATDRIVVISRRQFREIHERFRVGSARQFAVIPLGLDTEVYAGWAERRATARRELGADDADVLVGIVGRLTEIKNHRLFIEAAALYRKGRGEVGRPRNEEGTRVRFVVIGDGHLRAELEEHALSLGLAGDITFTGLRDDPESFYPALDVVALTSLNEGTPLTLIEAMACARAVIATDVGGVADLLGEEVGGAPGARAGGEGGGFQLCERGVKVSTNDAENFSRGLAHLIASAELRRELGERGRQFVAQHYSVERLLTDVLSLYEELTTAARQGPTRAVAETRNKITRVGEAARLKGD